MREKAFFRWPACFSRQHFSRSAQKCAFSVTIFFTQLSALFKELPMAGVKLVVMYPRPKDVDAFEKLYQKEHVPMAVEKLKGKTKFVATKVTGSPQGTPPFYRIAEVHFPSMDALQACAASEGGKETIGHAMRISS